MIIMSNLNVSPALELWLSVWTMLISTPFVISCFVISCWVYLQALWWQMEQDNGWLWSRGWPFRGRTNLQLWRGRVSPGQWLPGQQKGVYHTTIHHFDMLKYMLIVYILYILFALLWYQGLTLQSSQAVRNAKRLGWPLTEVEEALYRTEAPGGYPFYLVDKEQPLTGGSSSAPASSASPPWIQNSPHMDCIADGLYFLQDHNFSHLHQRQHYLTKNVSQAYLTAGNRCSKFHCTVLLLFCPTQHGCSVGTGSK